MEAVRSAYTARLIESSLGAPPYWLATEYVPGPTLREAVREGGPFPPGSALKLCAALAEGLAAVHAHGVTHRDLKPQNVILSPQGPQLIDFGIARGSGRRCSHGTGRRREPRGSPHPKWSCATRWAPPRTCSHWVRRSLTR